MLEQVAIENIENSIEEIERRVKIAKFNLQRYKGNIRIAQISSQNVIYACDSLRTDVE